VFTVSLGKQTDGSSRPVKVSYTYRTLAQKNGHLLYVDIAKPIKALKVELWYGDCGIRYVNVLDMITSSTQTRIAGSLGHPGPCRHLRQPVSFDGWVFPRSGVVFVWVLEGEVGLESR